jgi:hypothetical protein
MQILAALFRVGNCKPSTTTETPQTPSATPAQPTTESRLHLAYPFYLMARAPLTQT